MSHLISEQQFQLAFDFIVPNLLVDNAWNRTPVEDRGLINKPLLEK